MDNEDEKISVESVEDTVNIDKKDKHINKNHKCGQKFIMALLTVLILVLVVVLFSMAYAKYVTSKQGSATAQVGKMICKMEVKPCEDNGKTIVNPYCDVTIKSFNGESGKSAETGEGDVTETSINYKVKVVSTNGDSESLPKYYWEDSDKKKIAGNADVLEENNKTDLEGTFNKGEKAEKKYKIVFVNTGEQDVTKSIKFELTATQANGEKQQ